MHKPRLVIYFEPQCRDCEEGIRVLERVRPYEMFELEEVNINHDPVAYGLHSDKVPVVTINGQVAFRHHVDEDRLIRRLKQARAQMARDEEEQRKEAIRKLRGTR